MSTADAFELQNVISRYTNCVNRRDWSELPEIFSDDAVWEAPEVPDATFVGLDAVVAGIPALVQGTTSLNQLNTPSVISVDGDKAKAHCTIRETGSIERDGIRFEAHGIYDDELVRVVGKWKFSRRTFTLIENYFTPIAKVGAET